jgi:hypothetical protein
MRRHIGTMFALAGMLAIPGAYAQDSHRVVADAPFAFTVNHRALPAGEYEVSDGGAYGTVLIQSKDREHSVITIANSAVAKDPGLDGKLVFQRYGDRYFLREVFAPGVSMGRALPRAKGEREMASNQAGSNVEVAALNR